MPYCTADGPSGSTAKCAAVDPGGAISFQGTAGDFTDMLSLAFNIRNLAGGNPNVNASIGKASVRSLRHCFRSLLVSLCVHIKRSEGSARPLTFAISPLLWLQLSGHQL